MDNREEDLAKKEELLREREEALQKREEQLKEKESQMQSSNAKERFYDNFLECSGQVYRLFDCGLWGCDCSLCHFGHDERQRYFLIVSAVKTALFLLEKYYFWRKIFYFHKCLENKEGVCYNKSIIRNHLIHLKKWF